MSSEFWSTLNKKKREELLKSSQTKETSVTREETKSSDFWSALSAEKQNELLTSGMTSGATNRTFMSNDDDIAPVREDKGTDKSTVETTQAIFDKYGQYYNSADYDEYSQKGAAIKNPTVEEAEGWLTIGPWKFGDKEVGNIVTYSRDNVEAIAMGRLNSTKMVGNTIYRHMTDFEVGIYNYLLAKNGKDAAQEFLDDIEETLNAREGGMVAENIQNSGAVASTLLHGLVSVGSGMESAGTGLKQLFSEEALPTTATEFMNQELLDDLDGFAKQAYQAGNTVGNMLPSVAVGFISPTAGKILQSSSSAGNSYRQALKEGKTKEEAATFGVIIGSLEYATQSALSGVAGMTGDIPKKAMSKIATFKDPLLKVAAKYGVNLASEVTEEELQLWLEPLARSIAFGEDYDAPELEEMAETAIVTALSTGILNSSTDIATGNLTKVDGLTTNEAKVVEKVYEQRLAEESENKTLSNKDKNKLYERVVEEMKRGYVSTDEIESILGGETYEGYKSLTEKQKSLEERKTAIENEIKELVKTPESQFTVEQREKLTSLREEAKGIKDSLQNLGIKTAKNNLFNEVDKLTSKDTYLRESYNDLARKGQDIQIDENQYKGTKFEDAAKKTIANARNAGANNSNRVRDFVEFSAKYSSVSGTVVDFRNDNQIKQILEQQLNSQISKLSKSTAEADIAKLAKLQDKLKQVQEGKIKVNGVKTKDGVAININSSNYLNTVLGHEVTHFLESKKAYEALQKAAFKYAQTKGDYEGRREVLEVLYDGVDGTSVDYELTADLVGDYLFTDYDFIKNLSTENRNVFQYVFDQIKYAYKLATAGSKEARELEKVMHNFERALRESVETSQNAEQMKLVPKSDTQFMLSNSMTDIDKDDNIGYNEFDFYTDSEDFFLDVAKDDRADFPLSLSKKTTGMEKGETRTVEIYSDKKVYYFEATGYMQGRMLYSANIDDIVNYKRRKDYIYSNDGSRRLFNRWSSVLSSDRGRESSDIHSTEDRRAEDDVYGVYGESRKSNGTGTQERIGQNFEDDPKEVESIVAELRKMYGFAKNHPTNEIAPIKEVSSSDDAFFDGEKKQYSLSIDPKKADEDYSFAVNSGDTETAQKMVDEKAKENGYTVKAYHGTGRADRVGNVFLPERATSGPMAFFTDNKDIASNYARDKADTSLAYDEEYDSYYTQFRVNRNGKSISIPELWKHLSVSERNRIKEQAAHIKFDDDYETIIVDESAQHGNGAWDAYTLNMHRGNALEALVDTWLESGDLYNQEELFLEVLKNVGITDAEYRNPDARYEKVYDTWLKIQNPFDTDNANQTFYDGLSEWIDNNDMSAYEKESADADMWDKNNQTPESWLRKLEGDIESGTTHAWTVIPDFVTDYLKTQGYDGIKDKGGKGGGAGHTVWIPFSSEQVKSAEPITYDDNQNVIPLSQRFDSSKADIRNSLSYEGENRTLGGSYRFDGKDFLKSDIAPVAEGVAKNAPTQTVEDTTFDAPMLEDIPVLPDEELEQGTIAAIRPKPEKQPSMKKVTNAESKKHIAQVLTEEPKAEKKKKGIISTAIRNFVDKGAVFENLSLKTKNRALQDTYKAMGRSETKAQYFMENGTEGVKPLNDIIAEVEKTGKTKDFYEYLYHKHNVDRMSLEGRERPNLKRLTSKMNELKLLHLQENQLRAIASEKITNKTTPKRAELVKTVREYLKSKDVKNKPVFDYSVTAEMSQETAKRYEVENPDFKEYAQDVYDYMNHLRQMMVYNGVISPETAELWAKTYPYYVPIRRVDSNGLAVDVPLDTGRTGINAPIKRATGGNSDILPLFETMAQRTLQTFKAVDKNRFGIELKDTLGGVTESTTTSLDEVIDSIDAHESLLQEGKNGKNPTFTVFEGGERVTFEITDEMYDALKPTSEGLLYTNKVLNTASNLHRGVLTEYSVPFMVTNAIKDAQDVLINSQHPAQTYANSPVAIVELITKGKWYTEYMENGGGDNTYFDKQTNTFNKEKSALRKFFGFPFDKISDANNFIEKVPRLAEYIASRKKGASIDAAMLDAARVTTDFSAGGDVTKFLNRNGATFLNASVQGFAQQVRNVREAKANGLKGWLGLATKYAIAGLPALLLNHLLWDDDEEYEELSDYVKENYYVVAKYGDGKFVRIPKGRALAVIQNGFEQISNTLTGDDETDFGRFFELFLSNLAPNNPLDNNIIAPIKQVMENKTWYGEDLVPTRLQDLPAAEQYDESTDAISKWLGENLNVSPYKINYLLNQYSGGVGDIFLPMMTPEAESGDNSLLGNFIAPLKDKFTTDSVMNNQNVSDFYSKSDELKVKANSSNATEEDILKSKYMSAIGSELGELYKAKREIQNDILLSDSEKYAQVREIQKQINALAKESLNTYGNVASDDNYANVGDKHYKLNNDGEWQKISDKQVEKQAPFAKVYGGYSSYLTYSSDLYDIKADKDESGKSISGSRKEKVLNYINNLDADYETKIILWKSEYPSDDTYNMEIINYINNRTDLTYEERVSIFTELGFSVSNGSVYWD